MKKDEHKKRTIEDMKSLGTYRDEFLPLIDVYASMLEQWDKYEADPRTEPRRIEILRKDLITYSDRLLLNPKSRDSVDIKIESVDKLEKALESLG